MSKIALFIDIEDRYYDFKYRLLEPHDIANRCDKCPMSFGERTSHEYDEWESYCMYDKEIHEIEHCYTPMILLKLLASKYKKKFDYDREHQYDGLVEYMEKQGLFNDK